MKHTHTHTHTHTHKQVGGGGRLTRDSWPRVLAGMGCWRSCMQWTQGLRRAHCCSVDTADI